MTQSAAKKAPVKKPVAKKTAAKKVAAKPVAAKVSVGPVYVACRSFSCNGNDYKPGDVVPEANSWARVDSWVRARYVKVGE